MADRIAWIDNARMFAMFCVIIGHCSSMVASVIDEKETFNLFIVAFNMPLFVMISGYTSVKSIQRIICWKDYHDYILKISKRIALPNALYSVFTSCAVYCAQGHYLKSFLMSIIFVLIIIIAYYLYNRKNSVTTFICYALVLVSFFWTPLWFLPYIIMTMLLWGLSRIISVRYCRSLLTIQVAIFLSVSCLCWWFPFCSIIEFAPVFVIGFLLAHLNVFERLKHTGGLTVLLYFLGGVFCFFQYHSYENQFYKSNIFELIERSCSYVWFYREIASILISIGFMMLFRYCLNRKTYFSYMGTLTLAIYPIHSIYISVMRIVFNPLHIDYFILNTLAVIICALLLLFMTMITIMIINRKPFLRFALIGIK